MMLAHEGDHIAAAIGMMAGVQHDGDQRRIGRCQELLDLVLIFDMGLGMGMEDQLQAVILARDAGDAVGGIDQPGKSRVVQAGRRNLLAGEEVGVAILDQHQEFGIELVEYLAPAAQLPLDPGPGRVGIGQVAFDKGAGDLETALVDFLLQGLGSVGR